MQIGNSIGKRLVVNNHLSNSRIQRRSDDSILRMLGILSNTIKAVIQAAQNRSDRGKVSWILRQTKVKKISRARRAN